VSLDLLDDDDLGFATESGPAAQDARGATSSPRTYLIAALVALIVGASTFAIDTVGVQAVGYLLSSVICFLLVALARRQVAARLLNFGVAPSHKDNAAAIALLAIGLGQSILHSWLIGTHYA
jgi:hypothetical protein